MELNFLFDSRKCVLGKSGLLLRAAQTQEVGVAFGDELS